VPSRDEFLREAKLMFARTRSLDEIVDRAFELLLASVGSRLLCVEHGHAGVIAEAMARRG
jgi:stearoyl-CoA desaturase (delta-9 desaturase)